MMKQERPEVSEEIVADVMTAGAEQAVYSEPTHELELKFLASKETLARIREAPVITRHARNRGVARRLEAVYYDTPDQALHRRGLSLRVRRQGRRYVQTLKCSPMAGLPFERAEWESPVAGMVPDLGLLPAAEIGPLLDELASRTLGAVFTTKVRRRTQRLDLAGAQVEVAFDDGCIEVGAHREPLTEIELELKSGDPLALYDFGIELVETMRLRIGMQSKSDRGYDLAFGHAPAVVKAVAPTLLPGCTVDDIIAALLGSCQHHVLANQAAAEAGDDPEGVHQMRVALRRLRTVIALLTRELALPTLRAIGEDVRWLAQVLGAARDWDVFITETLSRPSDALGVDLNFDALRQAAEPHRRAAYAALRDALGSPRYTRFHLSLRRWIESRGWRIELTNRPLAVLLEPGPAFASRVLARLHRKARRRGRQFRHLPPAARHEVRIALKKLRYALEFFRGLHGAQDQMKDYLQSVAILQEILGHENDIATTLPRLITLADGVMAPGVERCIGAVMGWQARGRLETRKKLVRHWRRFKGMPAVRGN